MEVGVREPIGVIVGAGEPAQGDVSLPTILNRDEVVSAMYREYPASLREAGIGGTVVVTVNVLEDGTVEDVRVVNSGSGYPELDRAAQAVARIYRFNPAMRGDQPIAAVVTLPISWGATVPSPRATEPESAPATEEQPTVQGGARRISLSFTEAPIDVQATPRSERLLDGRLDYADASPIV